MNGIKWAHLNGISIAYETFGDESAVPVLLVMGLGSQMLGWDSELCEKVGRPGALRHSLRQPGHRPVHPPR